MSGEIVSVAEGANVAVVVGEDNAEVAHRRRVQPRRRRLRPARPRHPRRLRLGAAAEARPAGARPDHLRRSDRGAAAFTPNGDCRYDRIRIRFRTTTSDDGNVQIVKPGGKLVRDPGPRRVPQALPLPHLLLGRPAARRRHRAARPLQAAGEAARPGPGPGPAGDDPPAPGAAESRARRASATAQAPATAGPRAAELSGFLAAAGVLVAALASAAAILLPPSRSRSAAMLAALVLFPVLILGDQWHTHQIVDLRDTTAAGWRPCSLAGAVAVGALAAIFRRWPLLLPLAIVAALPFRVPLHSGGDTANLLVPLYLVIAGGVLAVDAPRLDLAAALARPPARPGAVAAAAARRLRRPLRAAGALLGRLLESAAEHLLLPRPLHRRLRAAERRRVGPAAALCDPGPGRGRGGRLRPDRLGRVRSAAASSGTTR